MLVVMCLLYQFIFSLNPFCKICHILIDFGTCYVRIDLSSGNASMSQCLANRFYRWRKRSIPTHLERHNPPTIIAKMGLKRA